MIIECNFILIYIYIYKIYKIFIKVIIVRRRYGGLNDPCVLSPLFSVFLFFSREQSLVLSAASLRHSIPSLYSTLSFRIIYFYFFFFLFSFFVKHVSLFWSFFVILFFYIKILLVFCQIDS